MPQKKHRFHSNFQLFTPIKKNVRWYSEDPRGLNSTQYPSIKGWVIPSRFKSIFVTASSGRLVCGSWRSLDHGFVPGRSKYREGGDQSKLSFNSASLLKLTPRG